MKLAFALFHYFPYGGLERDMLTVARTCLQRGHSITIYTGAWQGDRPADMRVVELPLHARTNHGRAREFSTVLQIELQREPADVVVGFNKMPGLDVYYAADVCFAAKAFEERNFFYRLTPRCRTYLALEKTVFDRTGKTEIMLITPAQREIYQRYYRTPAERLHLLPPGIRRECVMPGDYAEQRRQLRAQQAIADNELIILFVGSDYRRKGLDRALRGIAALSESLRRRVRLWVIGQDKQAPFINLARILGLENSVTFLGARDDVPHLMWSADLLLHPAYSEAAGLVLLEAMVAGMPVVASAVCGHAHYIIEHGLGFQLNDPMTPRDIASAIATIFSEDRATWRERSRLFVNSADIFSMPERAAAIIETVAARRLR
ncbi:MAG TPA: glycosyltransferase family 4 protein [Spongiibacteraceae bacterium]|jgi:UDP-glucose:(heptosyl)LPS alpha-1,3-glucosyltransferase